MNRLAMVGAGVLMLGVAGCGEQLIRTSSQSTSLFEASAMRIHPIFTQVKDWNDDGRMDGIEVLLEFQDQFEDPSKAAGRVIFELFDYRTNSPDPRGRRVGGPWVASLQTTEEQRLRWNRTSRTYSFQLNEPGIRVERSYVLSATFELSTGGRFFDRIVLPGKRAQETEREPSFPSTTPAPGSRTPQP